jgi:hypothetical protein
MIIFGRNWLQVSRPYRGRDAALYGGPQFWRKRQTNTTFSTGGPQSSKTPRAIRVAAERQVTIGSFCVEAVKGPKSGL